MPALPTRRAPITELWGVENSILLLHMSYHLSEIEGLRCQGGSLERGCLTHREKAGYRLLHRGHSLIAIFTHPFNVSITSMLKPMNVRKKILFFTTHGDQEEEEGSLGLGVYGQKLV